MKEDPGIEWGRKVRHEISAQFDHDPKRVLEYYREIEKQYKDRLVKRTEKEEPAEPLNT